MCLCPCACQSEYQRSYGTSRSRSVSPLAGLRSDHLSKRSLASPGLLGSLSDHILPHASLTLPHSGTSREPTLQRRRKAGLARSCGSLLFPPEVAAPAVRRTAAPPAGRTPTLAQAVSQMCVNPLTFEATVGCNAMGVTWWNM